MAEQEPRLPRWQRRRINRAMELLRREEERGGTPDPHDGDQWPVPGYESYKTLLARERGDAA